MNGTMWAGLSLVALSVAIGAYGIWFSWRNVSEGSGGYIDPDECDRCRGTRWIVPGKVPCFACHATGRKQG